MKTSLALTTCALLLGVAVAACGSDEPAVCGSVDDLKASIEDLRSIDVTSGDTLAELENGLATVRSDVDTVKADAKTEYSSELGAVETTYANLTTAVDDARTSPSETTLTAARSAQSAFGSDVDALVSSVEATC